VQLGGAVGTLSAFHGKGIDVMEGLASELQLATPVVPWHTDRTPMLKIAMAVGLASGTAAKVALDLVLLGQTEVGEVRERSAADRGGSSALPQKQNPVDAIEILATVRGVMAQAGVLAGSLVQEHERAAGAWQAEWSALSTLFLQAGGATARLAKLLSSVEIDADRMRKNVEASGGLLLAEQVTTALAERTDPEKARAMIDAVVRKTREGKRPFARMLEEDQEIGRHLSGQDLSAILDPGNALGQASALIDRVLEQHRKVAGATR
jgi:3-carboxy-cis,cis-muconate cycloisomerase